MPHPHTLSQAPNFHSLTLPPARAPCHTSHRPLYDKYVTNLRGVPKELADGHKMYLLRKALRTFNKVILCTIRFAAYLHSTSCTSCERRCVPSGFLARAKPFHLPWLLPPGRAPACVVTFRYFTFLISLSALRAALASIARRNWRERWTRRCCGKR
jgi:hypothetical protein